MDASVVASCCIYISEMCRIGVIVVRLNPGGEGQPHLLGYWAECKCHDANIILSFSITVAHSIRYIYGHDTHSIFHMWCPRIAVHPSQ